jgi:hypothetical protein
LFILRSSPSALPNTERILWCRVAPFQPGTKGPSTHAKALPEMRGDPDAPSPGTCSTWFGCFDGPNFWHVRANLGTRDFDTPPASTALHPPVPRVPMEESIFALTPSKCVVVSWVQGPSLTSTPVVESSRPSSYEVLIIRGITTKYKFCKPWEDFMGMD